MKIFKITTVAISAIGVFIILLWVLGYSKQSSSNEFNKEQWLKNNISIVHSKKDKDSIFELNLLESATSPPSLRRIGLLKKVNEGDTIVRELIFKTQPSDIDIWLLLRPIDDGNNRGVWVDMKNGYIGKQNRIKAKITILKNDYIKVQVKNQINNKQTKDWFYFSFVDGDGKYRLTRKVKDIRVYLKEPKFYVDSGIDLLKEENLLQHKITKFSFLEEYSHSTYMGLVFTFSLVLLVFKTFVLNKYLRFSLILLNLFIIYSLASKAVILSLLFLFPIYFYKKLFSYRFVIIFLSVCLLMNFNSHIKNRFIDMYETIINVDDEIELNDLNELSTKNRYNIYSNYSELIKENFLFGFGNRYGKEVVTSKYNHNFNAHCQYLQSFFNSGIFGFFLLFLFCFSPVIIFKRAFIDNYGIMFYIFVLLFNFLFESLLYRQWGLILVSFSFSIYFQIQKIKWFQ